MFTFSEWWNCCADGLYGQVQRWQQKLLRLTCFFATYSRKTHISRHCTLSISTRIEKGRKWLDKTCAKESYKFRRLGQQLTSGGTHLTDDVMYRFWRFGPQLTLDGIITVIKEWINEWIKNSWNKTTFARVPASHPITEFIVK